MINKFLGYVVSHNMIEEKTHVVAGVSGGADSVCLLFMLMELKKRLPFDFSLEVVHVNHMIRPDAENDARYVRELCAEFDIPFTLVEEDVEKKAESEHISTEEAGRIVRYNAFYDRIERIKQLNPSACARIAVAHNKNDSCETFLFNLFRGSALSGLCGIKPVRDEIIRPLLCLERYEIEQYLAQNNIKYCTDSTNLSDEYTRNRIRHHILGSAVSEISPASVKHIGNACDRISEAYELIMDMTNSGYDACVSKMPYNSLLIKKPDFDAPNPSVTEQNEDDMLLIKKPDYEALHPVIRGYVLHRALSEAAKSDKDIENKHIEALKELMEKKRSKRINLPYGIEAVRTYEGVLLLNNRAGRIYSDLSSLLPPCDMPVAKQHFPIGGSAHKKNKENSGAFPFTPEIKLPDEYNKIYETDLEGGSTLALTLIKADKAFRMIKDFKANGSENCSSEDDKIQDFKNIPQKKYTKFIDYDKIKSNPVIRNRQTGDYITVNAQNQKKTIKEYFINEKIPKELRDRIFLIADGNHVIWVIGRRISSYYKIDENTKNILKLEYIPCGELL